MCRFLERQDKPIVKTCAGRRTTTRNTTELQLFDISR
jgi:hypothetical protein